MQIDLPPGSTICEETTQEDMIWTIYEMVRRTPGAQFVESVLRDCFAAKRFGVNRF